MGGGVFVVTFHIGGMVTCHQTGTVQGAFSARHGVWLTIGTEVELGTI